MLFFLPAPGGLSWARHFAAPIPSDLTKDSKQTIVFPGKRVYLGVVGEGEHKGLGAGQGLPGALRVRYKAWGDAILAIA